LSKARRPPESDPLLSRVDALLDSHRHAQASASAQVPVLTDIVDLGTGALPAKIGSHDALEALADELQRTIMEQLGGDLDRVIEERLSSAVHQAIEQSLGYLRTELGETMREIVRAAVAASVARALAERFPPPPPAAPEKRARKR